VINKKIIKDLAKFGGVLNQIKGSWRVCICKMRKGVDKRR